MKILDKIFPSSSEKEVKSTRPLVEKINDLEPEISALSDEALKEKTAEFKKRLLEKETLDDVLPEAFAVVREVAKRTLGQRHFDVQLIGGITLHRGNIAEMRTGEGKTLVATLPAYLNALEEKGVHVITVNDYLARRDAVWMGQIYDFLGLSLSIVNQGASYLYDSSHQNSENDEERDEEGSHKIIYDFLRPINRSDAYDADITYGTNSEFGFDYLRDNIEYEKENLRQKTKHFAIIDEIDSILIDEARTPLIISAPSTDAENLYEVFAKIATKLEPEVDYEIDEKLKAISLTDEGINKAEKILGVDNIYTEKGIKYVHHLETAVRAKALFKKDKQYVLKDNSIVIVDEFTGRLQPSRRWSEGLHQAVEAKEGLKVGQESRTFASITYQNYFRMYDKLSGMTGTAETSSEEFFKVYRLETVVMPTNREIKRIDHQDLIYQSEKGKWIALTRKIKESNEKGQPILIGTASIDKNEQLSDFLNKEGIKHDILNAKNHEREAEIIASAGEKGSVTIATNMAGRGVDIKLGGVPFNKEKFEEIKELGGLLVIGTERHEARRIDNQLRGRAGRQGDPGETQFFVSMEDTLMRVFAPASLQGIMKKLGLPEDQPIQNKLITRSLETAQTKIEGFHFDSRKNILEFDSVLSTQRDSIYGRRKKILMMDKETLENETKEIIERGGEKTAEEIENKKEMLGEEEWNKTLKRLLLQTMDTFWIDHLETMDYTRSSVNLRAYGQRDPLIEYKKEALLLFKNLQESVYEQIINILPNIGAGAFKKEEEKLRANVKKAQMISGKGESGDAGAPKQTISNEPKIGRNDKVTIEKGGEEREMKFKKAEPLLNEGWQIKK